MLAPHPMHDIELDDLGTVVGGVNHTKKGWTEETMHKKGQLYYREVSPSGRKGRWTIVDTYWANDP